MSVKIFSLNDKRYFAGVDFGKGDDVAVCLIYRINDDGTTTIVKQNIIGKTIDFDKEKRKEFIKEIKELNLNEELKDEI